MTPLLISLAVRFLGTGNCSSKIVHGNFFSVPIAASIAVKFKRNLELKCVSSRGGTGYAVSLRGNSINFRGNTLTPVTSYISLR